jgi:soluble lytic murein transglycosylase-like protein
VDRALALPLHKRWLWLSFFGLLTIFVSIEARADIYIFIDSQGVMHFTNAPTSSNYKVYTREIISHTKAWYNVQNYDDVIKEAARRHGVAFSLLKALIHAESYFNPKAVSKKGALGLCQIMPNNLERLRVNDPFDPWENIMGGATYLKSLIERFNGELPLALAAYNAGPTVVEQYNDIPPFPETRQYVKKVMKLFHLYKRS